MGTVNPRGRVRFSQFVKEEILTGPTRTQTVDSSDMVALLGRVADNDRAAFATLYDALSPVVFGTILKTIRSRDHAVEVTQEVFLEIWRKAGEWVGRLGSPVTWLLVMARRRAIDRIRSEEALKRREDRVAPTWVAMPHSEVEEAITTDEDHLEVREGLSALSDLQRQVIELAYFGDHTYVEVADMLDLPLGTVKTRMRDGLMRLRQGLGVVT
jgi:RNA polymerase sigma-70 factor (ECF subfamily)